MKRILFIISAAVCLALAYSAGSRDAEGKPATPLLSMADNPRLVSSAIALDQAGGIYSGQSGHWSRVGATPSAPAALWTRPSTGEVFIALTNGDLYRLESNWTLTYDSNVFLSQ